MTENYWDLDDNDTSDEMSWFEQRFRLGAKLNVVEGVTANLRFDFSEDYWGSDTWGGTTTWPANDGVRRFGGNRNTGGNELQVDRAYIEVNKENYMFRVGQIYQGLGNGIVVDQNRTGLTVKAKLPVAVEVMYAKLSEGQNGSKNDDGTEQDSDFFALNAGFKKDDMSVNAFLATIINQTNLGDDDTPLVIGVQGKTDINGIKLNCELDFFTGEQSSDVDYVGTQLFVDANTMVGDHKIGAMFFLRHGHGQGR